MMLRFFASMIGCVAMLSGGLMGWVRYAQQDPEYSCLSFDNITVQLDTSLFMRGFFANDKVQYGRDYHYETDTVAISVEPSLPHLNRLSPLPAYIDPRLDRWI